MNIDIECSFNCLSAGIFKQSTLNSIPDIYEFVQVTMCGNFILGILAVLL